MDLYELFHVAEQENRTPTLIDHAERKRRCIIAFRARAAARIRVRPRPRRAAARPQRRPRTCAASCAQLLRFRHSRRIHLRATCHALRAVAPGAHARPAARTHAARVEPKCRMVARCMICAGWIMATDACAYFRRLINHRDKVHLRYHIPSCTAFSSDNAVDWCEWIFSRLSVQVIREKARSFESKGFEEGFSLKANISSTYRAPHSLLLKTTTGL